MGKAARSGGGHGHLTQQTQENTRNGQPGHPFGGGQRDGFPGLAVHQDFQLSQRLSRFHRGLHIGGEVQPGGDEIFLPLAYQQRAGAGRGGLNLLHLAQQNGDGGNGDFR